jgi:hypothetical protein
MEKKLNAWQQWKKDLGDTRPWDLIDPRTPLVTKEVSDKRFSICLECPELIQLTKQCKKCGCFMVGKTKLVKASCPLGKW